jgi:hypothetical protein
MATSTSSSSKKSGQQQQTQPQSIVPAEPLQPPAAATTTSTAVALLSRERLELARSIDKTVQSFTEGIRKAEGHTERAFLMADAIAALRRAITPEAMTSIMGLYGSPNGFSADRPNKSNRTPYDEETVKECLITSLIHGFYPINKEWGIIGGNFYGQQNGYRRKLAEVAGISDISCVNGRVTRAPNSPALIRVSLRWKLHGVPDALRDPEGKPGVVYAVKCFGSEADDALIGKAIRKAYKAAYEKATGSINTEDSRDDEVSLGDSQTLLLGESAAAAAPPPSSRTSQAAAALGVADQSPPVAQLRQKAADLRSRLQILEEDWANACAALGAPVDLNLFTRAQLDEMLRWLDAEDLRISDELAAEREAMMQ